MTTLSIREPYWGAYKRFGWEDKVWGVGVNAKALAIVESRGEEYLGLIVGKNKDRYKVKISKAYEFCVNNDCTYNAHGTKLYVIPRTLLEKDEK